MANSCFFTILTILIAIFAINVGTLVFVMALDVWSETPSSIIASKEDLLVFLAIDTVFVLMLIPMGGLIVIGMLFLEQSITNPV